MINFASVMLRDTAKVLFHGLSVAILVAFYCAYNLAFLCHKRTYRNLSRLILFQTYSTYAFMIRCYPLIFK